MEKESSSVIGNDKKKIIKISVIAIIAAIIIILLIFTAFRVDLKIDAVKSSISKRISSLKTTANNLSKSADTDTGIISYYNAQRNFELMELYRDDFNELVKLYNQTKDVPEYREINKEIADKILSIDESDIDRAPNLSYFVQNIEKELDAVS